MEWEIYEIRWDTLSSLIQLVFVAPDLDGIALAVFARAFGILLLSCKK